MKTPLGKFRTKSSISLPRSKNFAPREWKSHPFPLSRSPGEVTKTLSGKPGNVLRAFVIIWQHIHDKYTKAGEISWYKCLRGVGYIASVWWRQKSKTGLKLKFYLFNILYTMVLRLNCPTVLSSPWKHHFYYTYANTESFTKIAINIQYVVFEVYGRVSAWSIPVLYFYLSHHYEYCAALSSVIE